MTRDVVEPDQVRRARVLLALGSERGARHPDVSAGVRRYADDYGMQAVTVLCRLGGEACEQLAEAANTSSAEILRRVINDLERRNADPGQQPAAARREVASLILVNVDQGALRLDLARAWRKHGSGAAEDLFEMTTVMVRRLARHRHLARPEVVVDGLQITWPGR